MRLVIISVTFIFWMDGNKIVFFRYHKNTLFKILVDFKKTFKMTKTKFLKTTPIQNQWIQKIKLWSFKLKNIYHTNTLKTMLNKLNKILWWPFLVLYKFYHFL